MTNSRTFGKAELWTALTIFSHGGEELVLGVSKKSEKAGITDLKHNLVIPLYDEIHELGKIGSKYDCLKVKDGKKEGIITLNNEVIFPFIYDELRLIYEANATIVCKNGRYGVLNGVARANGELIIPMAYDEIYYGGWTSNGKHYFRVRKDGKTGLVTRDNKLVFPFNFTDFETTGWILDDLFSEKQPWVLVTQYNGKILHGIARFPSGEIVIPVEWNEVHILKNNLFLCGKWRGELVEWNVLDDMNNPLCKESKLSYRIWNCYKDPDFQKITKGIYT